MEEPTGLVNLGQPANVLWTVDKASKAYSSLNNTGVAHACSLLFLLECVAGEEPASQQLPLFLLASAVSTSHQPLFLRRSAFKPVGAPF